MTNACWLENDNPYAESYDNLGNVCSNYGTSDYITAIVVFSILVVILIGLGIGWIVRYSKRAARFRAFWNQPSAVRSADFIELQTTTPYSPHDALSPPSPSSPSAQSPTRRPKYAVPVSSSRPLSMAGGSSRGSSIYSNDTYQQDSRNSRRGSSLVPDAGDRTSVAIGGAEGSRQMPRIRRSPLSTYSPRDERADVAEENGMLSPRSPLGNGHGAGQWGEAVSTGYGDGGLRGESSSPTGSPIMAPGESNHVYHPSAQNANSSSAALAQYGPDHSFDNDNAYQPQVYHPDSASPTPPRTSSASAADRLYAEDSDVYGSYETDEPIGTFVPPSPSKHV